jgi:hypothetical protein
VNCGNLPSGTRIKAETVSPIPPTTYMTPETSGPDTYATTPHARPTLTATAPVRRKRPTRPAQTVIRLHAFLQRPAKAPIQPKNQSPA